MKTKLSTQEKEEYNFDESAEEVASAKGLVVVFPEDNQLQIDLDSDEAYKEFDRRLEAFELSDTHFESASVVITPSASGLPHRHVTITFPRRTFDESPRMLLQAALNDDPLRVFLNARRFIFGVKNPTRLFEKPE